MNAIHKTLAICCADFLVAGCASSPESLRTHDFVSFTANKPLAEVYQVIKTKAETCNPGSVREQVGVVVGSIPTRTTVKTDWSVNARFSEDTRQAQLSISFSPSGLPATYALLVEMAQSSPGSTQVKTYYLTDGWKTSATRIEKWVYGTSQNCLGAQYKD